MSQRSLIERIPRYLLHKPTNRGYARFDGHFIYFGSYNSAASLEAYNRYVAEWIQNGGRLATATYCASVADVVVAYTEFATGYYRKGGKPTDELRLIKVAVKIVRQLYGRSRARLPRSAASRAHRSAYYMASN
jgi:hypothetical protein